MSETTAETENGKIQESLQPLWAEGDYKEALRKAIERQEKNEEKNRASKLRRNVIVNWDVPGGGSKSRPWIGVVRCWGAREQEMEWGDYEICQHALKIEGHTGDIIKYGQKDYTTKTSESHYLVVLDEEGHTREITRKEAWDLWHQHFADDIKEPAIPEPKAEPPKEEANNMTANKVQPPKEGAKSMTTKTDALEYLEHRLSTDRAFGRRMLATLIYKLSDPAKLNAAVENWKRPDPGKAKQGKVNGKEAPQQTNEITLLNSWDHMGC